MNESGRNIMISTLVADCEGPDGCCIDVHVNYEHRTTENLGIEAECKMLRLLHFF